ncbi:MAG: DUF4105 domain-containing protein [Candidatus Pacebacteria bacterium]|nr:DUF4105 domain-containing protein [Candidatus Paceibacterota bacterium]
MRFILKLIKWAFFIIASIAVLLAALFTYVHFTTSPSNDRSWTTDQAILSYADIKGNLISIHDIRNFTYASTTSFTPNYYDKTFNINKLVKVWYIVEPFSGIPGSAHTFLSFEFENNEFISISIEIRKEKGESFSPISGLFNQYELMYVIADERDVIKLRSNYRKDKVYVYPIKASIEKERALFLDMINRANTLKEHPEFYNTLTNTCTTNIAAHINKITPHSIPFLSLRILFPANSDKLAYDLGLIDTDLSFTDARTKYFINDKAIRYADNPNFSVRIRE